MKKKKKKNLNLRGEITMKKLLMIFGLILGLATITNANTAEAKVLTKKEAAKKIAISAKKAYKTKKNVTVTFQTPVYNFYK